MYLQVVSLTLGKEKKRKAHCRRLATTHKPPMGSQHGKAMPTSTHEVQWMVDELEWKLKTESGVEGDQERSASMAGTMMDACLEESTQSNDLLWPE